MAAFDASESLTPFKIVHDAHGSGRVDDTRGDGARDYEARGDGAGGYVGEGAILCDVALARQAGPDWFSPGHWGESARRVDTGGRGGAWFVDTPAGPAVLRQYLRGGWAARVSRDLYLWRGADHVRSFAEYRLTRMLQARGLPVPMPIAACYRRHGPGYRAGILLGRLHDVVSLARRAGRDAQDAPWEQTGELIARFHRAGLDHADLNAHNILFDSAGLGWVIDFDKGRLRIPATSWREANLRRLRRSLLKLRGRRDANMVLGDFRRLRSAYDAVWERGY